MTATALTGREYRMTPEGQADLMRSMQPFIDQANEARERVRAICAPVLEMQARMQVSLAPMVEVRERIVKVMTPALRIAEELRESRQMTIPARIFHAPPGPQTVKIDQEQLDSFLEKLVARTVVSPEVAAIDLVYNRKEKMLSRSILGKEYTASFVDNAENKRLQAFNKLLGAKRPIQTKILAKQLDYTVKQTENLMQNINTKIVDALGLKEPFIQGERGKGYRINSRYTIQKN